MFESWEILSSYFFAQLETSPAEDVVGEIFQGVMPATTLLLFIGGALLLVVLLLRFAAKMNALPQDNVNSSSRSSVSQSSEEPESSPSNHLSSGSDANISIKAQSYQSVSVEWSIPVAMSHDLQQDRDKSLMIRLLDVTQIDLATQLPHAIYDYPCDWGQDDSVQVMGIAVVQGDRDYIAELGYMTADLRWQQLARSTHVRVAATVSSS